MGDQLDVDWVDIEDPDPSSDTVRDEARGKGAAIITRGEGIWYADGAVYFSATSGDPLGLGQIFRYAPATSGSGGTLTLLAQSEVSAVLQKPDNVAMAPSGELFICEDGDGDNFLRVLGADGRLNTFARNALSGSELAGACFSPDGRALFVNLQADGLTLAVTGPFPTPVPPPDDGGVPTHDAGVAMGGDGGAPDRGDAGAGGDGGTGGSDDPGGMTGGSTGRGCSISPAPSSRGVAGRTRSRGRRRGHRGPPYAPRRRLRPVGSSGLARPS